MRIDVPVKGSQLPAQMGAAFRRHSWSGLIVLSRQLDLAGTFTTKFQLVILSIDRNLGSFLPLSSRLETRKVNGFSPCLSKRPEYQILLAPPHRTIHLGLPQPPSSSVSSDLSGIIPDSQPSSHLQQRVDPPQHCPDHLHDP